MYEMIHTLTAGLPVADLFLLPATLSPLALAPFVFSGVVAGLIGFARRSNERSPDRESGHIAPSTEAPERLSAAARGASHAWISRTGGVVRL